MTLVKWLTVIFAFWLFILPPQLSEGKQGIYICIWTVLLYSNDLLFSPQSLVKREVIIYPKEEPISIHTSIYRTHEM